MDKKRLLVPVNGLMALAFAFTALGGLVRFFAPDLLPYDAFRRVHPLAGILFVLLAALHIYLNGAWIRSTYFKRK